MKSNLIAAAKSATQQAVSQQIAPLNLNEEVLPAHSAGGVGEQIVGTWHVAYTTEGSASGQAFIQWHSDGTEWENISFPVLGGNICMGSWKVIDRCHVYRNHYGWLFNDGVVAGYFNETETDTLAWDGNSYTGSNDTKFYDLTGTKKTLELTGTASARRPDFTPSPRSCRTVRSSRDSDAPPPSHRI